MIEKLKKTLEAGKSLGLFVSTPAIYVGKFLIDQWYILAGAFGAALASLVFAFAILNESITITLLS